MRRFLRAIGIRKVSDITRRNRLLVLEHFDNVEAGIMDRNERALSARCLDVLTL
jgi:hypothetical protein